MSTPIVSRNGDDRSLSVLLSQYRNDSQTEEDLEICLLQIGGILFEYLGKQIAKRVGRSSWAALDPDQIANDCLMEFVVRYLMPSKLGQNDVTLVISILNSIAKTRFLNVQRNAQRKRRNPKSVSGQRGIVVQTDALESCCDTGERRC